MFPGLTNMKGAQSPWANSSGLGSDNKMVNGIATQNLGGNSLTQQMRSLQNWLSTNGAGTYQEGRDTTNAGIQGFNTAGDTTGKALGTTDSAMSSLSPAEDYWTKLLSGDQKTMNQAVAPVATQAGTNYANAASNVGMNGARGGYAAALGAGLPQAQAREVNNALYALQPTAATNLNTIAGTKNAIAGTQSNIAGVQGQLANWLASLGIDISKLGLSGVQSASDSILNSRGQDVAEHGQAMQMADSMASTAASAAAPFLSKLATNAGATSATK
jgi:hypothetical protein